MSQFEEIDMCIHIVKATNDGECIYTCGNYAPEFAFCYFHTENQDNYENVKSYEVKVGKDYCRRTIEKLKALTNLARTDFIKYNTKGRNTNTIEREIIRYQTLLEDYQWALHKMETKPINTKVEDDKECECYNDDDNYEHCFDNSCEYDDFSDVDRLSELLEYLGPFDSVYDLI